VVLPTGFGKSRVGVEAAKIYGGRVLVIAPRKPLALHWKKELEKWGGQAEVVVINSATKWKDVEWDLVVVDEVHRSGGPVFSKLYEINSKRWLGLTATIPEEWGNIPNFMRVVYSKNIGEAVESGAISDFKLFNIVLEQTGKDRLRYTYFNNLMRKASLQLSPYYREHRSQFKSMFDFVKWGLSQKEEIGKYSRAWWTAMSKRKSIVFSMDTKLEAVKKLNNLLWGRKVLWVTKTIDHANQIAEVVGCPTFHSKLNRVDSEELLKWFTESSSANLVGVDSLNEGVDIPDLEVIVIVSGISKQLVQIQQIGRVVRKKAGKEPLVLNFCVKDNV